MATYTYTALTSAGRMMTGTLEASSRQQAHDILAEMQLTASTIEEARRRQPRTRIGRAEFMLFNQQLASLTKAGIPLARGLRELSEDIGSRPTRRLVGDIAADIESGTGVSEAVDKRAQAFPALYGQIIKAGVTSGKLGEMLIALNRHMESAGLTRRILFEATAYPLIVACLAAGVLTAIFGLVIPSYKVAYAEIGGNLPEVTRMLVAMSDHLWEIWLVVGCALAGVVALWMLLSASPAGKRLKESILLSLPILGRLRHRAVLARLADSMATLVASGCDMPTCLRLGAGASGCEAMALQCDRIAEGIERGESILDAGAGNVMIPPLFLYSVQFGSQRNELQDNLHLLAGMYRQQVEAAQSRLQAVLLPILLVIVGGLLSLVLMAMFLPMVSMIRMLSSA